MALTNNQLNSHLRQLVTLLFTRDEEALDAFVRVCIRYSKTGGAAEKEAARTSLREVYSRVVDRSLTADDLHMLISHKIGDHDNAVVGDF